MSRDERRLSAVPAWLWAALGAALAAQIALHGARVPAASETAGLPPPRGFMDFQRNSWFQACAALL